MIETTKSDYFVITPLFLGCMCSRNKDGTKNLVLNGSKLFSRIRRRIVDEDVHTICEFLKENPKVKFLYLPYNNITSKGVKELANLLKENESIQLLNLMNNDIDARGVLTIAKLGNYLNLTTLRLNGNPIGDRGGKNLALMLLKNNKLHHLDISQTDQTIESLVCFTTVLKHDNTTLEHLNISRVLGQWYYQLLDDHVAQVVGEMLRFNKSLKEIHLEKLSLTDHDMELLVNGLMENKTLQVLNLACNQIGDFGLECLCEYLGTSPPLKKLLLHHNHIRDGGARAFSFKYPHSKLEFLDISENRLTENGVLDILNSIRKPYPIEYLFIRGNKLGPRAYKVIYRMLLSEVLYEDKIDVKIYKTTEKVDGKYVIKFECAYNITNDHTQPEYYGLCVDKKEFKRINCLPE